MLEHKHLILKGNMSRAVSVDDVSVWLKELVELLNMELIKEFPHNPAVAHIGGDNSGVTGCALITTSHIVLHTWDNSLDFQLDVYSCKTYNTTDVKLHCEKLGFKIVDKRFFDRKYNIIDEDI